MVGVCMFNLRRAVLLRVDLELGVGFVPVRWVERERVPVRRVERER